MNKGMEIINSTGAPQPIGQYSQAIKVANTLYLSGQIPLDPHNMQLIEGGFDHQVRQVFENILSVCEKAGGSLKSLVKLTVYLIDLEKGSEVNFVMKELFETPPARAMVEVSKLPMGAKIEIDAVAVIE